MTELDDPDRRYLKAARTAIGLDRESRQRSVRVDGENVARFQAAYPIARHAIAQIDSALLLHDSGRAYAATANARVAFEHALIAQWIVLTAGSEYLVKKAVDRHNRNMVNDLRRHGEVPEELAIPQSERHEPRMPTIEAICDRFDGNQKLIYLIYRGLTGAVHVSASTLANHVSVGERSGDLVLHPYPKSDDPPMDFAMALGWSSLMALSAIERLKTGGSLMAEVSRIAMDAGIPHDLAVDDRNPALQPVGIRKAESG